MFGFLRQSDQPGSAIRLRPARPDDAALLRRWDEQPHVIASSGDDGDWLWEQELPRQVPWRDFLMAELDGRPIGFLQIIAPAEEESRYWGEDCPPNLRAIDIWIGEPDCLGQGHGTEMMREALAHCFKAPEVTAVLIDPLASNTRAIRFYERMGFAPVGRRVFGDDDCMVLRIGRAEWEARTA